MRRNTYTSGEAAKCCGLALSTLKRWIRRGALKSYRTPGGDVRILHENLIDFMREYGIPFMHLEQSGPDVCLVCVDQQELTNPLVEAARFWEKRLRVQWVDSDMALGLTLAKTSPRFLILQARDPEQDLMRCSHIREALRPNPLRIGMIGSVQTPSEAQARPDVWSDPGHSAEWAVELFAHLLGETPALLMPARATSWKEGVA